MVENIKAQITSLEDKLRGCHPYSAAQLEARLDQLSKYESQYNWLTSGFVGKREIEALEALASEYHVEFDDWFSDRVEVEKALAAL